MPYAKGQTLSQKPIEGGIRISDEQYRQAVQDKLAGKLVAVKGGSLQTFEETTRTVYAAADRSPLTLSAEEETPTGYVDQEPPGRWYEWDGTAWVHDAEGELADWRASAVVSRFQARAALRQAGLRDQVEGIMADPATDPLVVDAWADAQEFRRNSPTIASLGAALSLSDAEIDALFEQAAGIEA